MSSQSKEDDVAPGTDMATSPAEVFSTPPREKVDTPPQATEGVAGVTPIINEEDIEKEIIKISELSQQLPTPKRQNQFIIGEYWESVGVSAKNLKFSESDLEKRLEMKSLFKSHEIRKAKGLLESFSGGDKDISYPQIGRPSQIETSEQVDFVKLLHKTIKETEKGPTTLPKKQKTSKMPTPAFFNKK